MYEFNDPQGRGRAAIIALQVWIVVDLAFAISQGMTIAAIQGYASGAGPAPETADSAVAASGIALLVTNLVTMVLVARWIMRVNANAHAVSDTMTITPGWNVGWFFVPIATWWKPFQGLRETWQASAAPENPASVAVPGLMRWWWGLWLATSILGNISFQLSIRANTADAVILGSWIDIVSFALDVPLAYTLITLIRRLNALQLRGHDYSETFA
jgi:hypothetical protein